MYLVVLHIAAPKRPMYINDGWIPQKKEGVTSWYGSRWNPKESKPRTEYQLYKDGYVYKISKTDIKGESYRLKERKEFMRQKQQIVNTLFVQGSI